MSDTPSSTSILRIRPSRGLFSLGLAEMWQYRELLYFFAWRDIKVKYKQTLLGMSWAVIGPVIHTAIFVLIFGLVAKLPSDGLPKPLFYMGALVAWKYFADAFAGVSQSLVASANMLTKIYFPRLLIPLARCLTGLVDLAVALVMLLGLMCFYGVWPSATLLYLPLLVFMAMGTALGVGLVFASLNVRYRDVRVLVPFISQMWMYASVIFPFSRLPESWGNWRFLYGLNPMAGVVEGFRWCCMHAEMTAETVVNRTVLAAGVVPKILGDGQQLVKDVLADGTVQMTLIEVVRHPVSPPIKLLCVGIVSMLCMFAFGLFYFKRMESQFADIV